MISDEALINTTYIIIGVCALVALVVSIYVITNKDKEAKAHYIYDRHKWKYIPRSYPLPKTHTNNRLVVFPSTGDESDDIDHVTALNACQDGWKYNKQFYAQEIRNPTTRARFDRANLNALQTCQRKIFREMRFDPTGAHVRRFY